MKILFKKKGLDIAQHLNAIIFDTTKQENKKLFFPWESSEDKCFHFMTGLRQVQFLANVLSIW